MRLFRGLTYIVGNYVCENTYLINPRKPVHTNINIHYVADNWFHNKFGVRARSETIFCTADLNQALKFGNVHEIKLTNSSENRFIYSLEVIDFIEIEEEIDNYDDKEEITEWLESKHYRMEKSVKDIPSEFKGEIMLYCKEYEIKEL